MCRRTITVEEEHLRTALEALEILEGTPRCLRFKAARKAIRGAQYAAIVRDLDADSTPAVVRLQAG